MLYLTKQQPTILPPGPKGLPLRGVFPQFVRDPLALLCQSAAYGDIVALRLFNRTGYLLNHPDYIKHVLVDNSQNYRKGRGLSAVKPVVGQGLLTSEGEFHLRQRRLMQPAFHRRQIAGFADTMVAATTRHIAAWPAGHRCDLHHELMRLTMTIVGQTLFGVDVTTQNEGLARLLDELLGEFSLADATPWGLLLANLPTARQRRRRQLLHTLDETILGFIAAARQRPVEQLDLLAMLLAAQEADETGGMSDQQLRDELMTLFIAGHETTANALTWSFYLLSQHPAVEARLHAELAEVLDGRLPTLADVPQLKYTRMLFSEAMRLYPPAWIIGRQAIADDTIGGYPIPADAPVFVSQWVMHRHPAYWLRPDVFDPTRFDEASPTYQKPPRYVYFPFGGGSRLCIGEQFAWMEGVLLIATLAQRFRVRLTTEAPLPRQASVTLRPAEGMPVVLLGS